MLRKVRKTAREQHARKMKDPFLKTVSYACQILARWHNVYGHNPKYTEANDGVALAMTGTTEETGARVRVRVRVRTRKRTLHVLNAKRAVTI